ncbi:MAG TPA: TonB family protein [Vicinamibacterales bacterium]|jgi:TonB family protein|nr:TonB family protein [Vicinamibacterales bacterium]
MRLEWTRAMAILSVTVLVSGCGSPPQPEINAANAALEKARSSQATQYAGGAMREAETSKAALDTELKVQEQKWVKSYDRARELAAATTAAAERASSEAVTAREAAERKASAAKAAEAKRAATTAAAVRAGKDVRQPVKIKDVAPVYPATAKSARVGGTVVIEATIDTDGKVTDAHVVKSVPLLDQAALDAVRQWEYRPSTVGGKPVPVLVTVNVNFVRS